MEVESGDLQIVVPGDVVGSTSELQCGQGCFVRGTSIHASVVGKVLVEKSEDKKVTDNNEGGNQPAVLVDSHKPRISILRPQSLVQEVVPKVGDTVTCKVTKVSPRMANVDILCVGPKAVRGNGFRALIRKENVRISEVDKVVITECFRPGDIVRAEVAALGTARSFELTTAKNEYGVITAVCSSSKENMIPISWQEMKCPVTNIVEKRKVAKV
mmetsp:Transcript_10299/g.12859  ORF Transcript_10299/g.12859 Transcript_10299/m.12859 type:complete len:214 (+) Transcript_10299:90-731(+)|eukprot:CAMPEP_0204825424 /NCGR_PEP_ID=MMETSP1346-20131115/3322_1 /ASSEMBLY_ACC=CAM_ASM_000771 /TAXON_ID=215587 /ORGANISM="Aplanochytrium stocchinoi, Strain GSBS06" /LENGTH=213 /DNA_ID=CAMNT_0051953059 /DNA_START=35 /DNA_END=676 /DNA_ORIENTATION=-